MSRKALAYILNRSFISYTLNFIWQIYRILKHVNKVNIKTRKKFFAGFLDAVRDQVVKMHYLQKNNQNLLCAMRRGEKLNTDQKIS